MQANVYSYLNGDRKVVASFGVKDGRAVLLGSANADERFWAEETLKNGIVRFRGERITADQGERFLRALRFAVGSTYGGVELTE